MVIQDYSHKDLEFLVKSVLSLVEMQTEDEMFHFAAQSLSELIEGAFVVTAEVENEDVTSRAIAGLGAKTQIVLNIMGMDPVGLKLKMLDKERESILKSGRLTKMEGGLYKFLSGQIPQPVCSALEKMDGAKDIYLAGLTKKGILFGAAVIFIGEGTQIHNSNIAEIFTGQVAMALQKNRIEADLTAANEKLKQLDRLKSNFISNISHELFTPLVSIKGFAATILGEENMDRITLTRFIRIIDEEADNLTALINRIIKLSSFESGNVSIKKEKVDVSSIVRELIKCHVSDFRMKDITFSSSVPEKIEAYVDAKGINEAVENIINNALKFSKRNGKIRVDMQEKDGEVLISVSDSGGGIAKEDLPHIFEKFYVSENQMNHPGDAGIGLALASYVVRQHKGQIWAESEPGRGTRINISLPKNG